MTVFLHSSTMIDGSIEIKNKKNQDEIDDHDTKVNANCVFVALNCTIKNDNEFVVLIKNNWC